MRQLFLGLQRDDASSFIGFYTTFVEGVGQKNLCTVENNTLVIHNSNNYYSVRSIILDVTPAYAVIAFQRYGWNLDLENVDIISTALTKIDYSEYPRSINKYSFDMEYTGESGTGKSDLLSIHYIQDKWPASWIDNFSQRTLLNEFYVYRVYF